MGEEQYGYTDTYNFTSPPAIGTSDTSDGHFRIIAFGDLGDVPIDFTEHHSWDNYNEGELGSINTTNAIYNYFLG